MKKRFSCSVEFIPFVGMGIGYQPKMRGIDIIVIIPFMTLFLTYNYKKH